MLFFAGFLLISSLESANCSVLRHIRSKQDAALPSIERSTDDESSSSVNNNNNNNKTIQLLSPTIPSNNTNSSSLNLGAKSINNNVELITKETNQLINNISSPNIEKNLENNNTSGKETARSLNIDIDKYVSPEFHNKNNVYVLPTSPEIEKYINEDPEDYTDHITAPDYIPNSETIYRLNLSSTTPLSDLLQAKFRLVADAIKQNLEDIENIKHPDNEGEVSYKLPDLVDQVINQNNNNNNNNIQNDTEVKLHVLETTNLELNNNNNDKNNSRSGDRNLETSKKVDYESTYLKTKTYDIKPENKTKNNIENDTKTTEASIYATKIVSKVNNKPGDIIGETSTTIKTIKKPTPRYLGRNTNLNNAKPEKSNNKPKPSVEASSINPIFDYINTTMDNLMNISKRGSTKFKDLLINKSTTLAPVTRSMDIDNKGFSIPPSATAWSLATLKDTPDVLNNSITTKGPSEQTVQENNIIKVTVAPPKHITTQIEEEYVFTTDIIPNTDVITTETLPKTTPTTFWTTVMDIIARTTANIEDNTDNISSSLKSTEVEKGTEKDGHKNENEIFKNSEEVSEAIIIKSNTNEDSSDSSTRIMEDIIMNSTTLKTVLTDRRLGYNDSSENEDVITSTTIEVFSDESTKMYDDNFDNSESTTVEGDVVSTTDFETEFKTSIGGVSYSVSSSTSKSTKNITEQRTNETIIKPISSSTTPNVTVNITTTVSSKHNDVSNSTEKSTTNTIYTTEENDETTVTTEALTPFFNIEKKQSTPSLLQPIEDVGGNFEIEEIDDHEFQQIENRDNKHYGPIKPKVEDVPKHTSPSSSVEDEDRRFIFTSESTKTLVNISPKPSVVVSTTKQTVITQDSTTATEMLSHDDDDDDNNTGMIAAIAISSVAAVCLVLLAGLLVIKELYEFYFLTVN